MKVLVLRGRVIALSAYIKKKKIIERTDVKK